MTKPIPPDEVADRKSENIPGEVYEAFNEMIAKKWVVEMYEELA